MEMVAAMLVTASSEMASEMLTVTSLEMVSVAWYTGIVRASVGGCVGGDVGDGVGVPAC